MEYPDIEVLAKKIGVPATHTKDDGTTACTHSIINDPWQHPRSSPTLSSSPNRNTSSHLPENTLFPPGTKPLIAAFEGGVVGALGWSLLLQLAVSCHVLNPSSEKYFRRIKEAKFGQKIRHFQPEGPKRDADLAKGKEGPVAVDGWLAKSEGKFVFGDTVSYTDDVLAGWLI